MSTLPLGSGKIFHPRHTLSAYRPHYAAVSLDYATLRPPALGQHYANLWQHNVSLGQCDPAAAYFPRSLRRGGILYQCRLVGPVAAVATTFIGGRWTSERKGRGESNCSSNGRNYENLFLPLQRWLSVRYGRGRPRFLAVISRARAGADVFIPLALSFTVHPSKSCETRYKCHD